MITPPVAPKPELTPLTGGYRRTPVLQIGADIYCDTRMILAELERRHPTPTLYPADLDPTAHAIAHWAETQLFRPISLTVSATNRDVLPATLQADRSVMRGLPVPTEATMREAGRRSAPAVRVGIVRVEQLLSDGRPWIAGAHTSIADFAVNHALWFITARTDRLAHELAPFVRIVAWMTRMRSFGHGRTESMTATAALDVAASSTPGRSPASRPFAEDPAVGTRVRIRADDYGRDAIDGELAYIDAEEIAVRRMDARVGEVAVHVPRIGYDLRALP